MVKRVYRLRSCDGEGIIKSVLTFDVVKESALKMNIGGLLLAFVPPGRREANFKMPIKSFKSNDFRVKSSLGRVLTVPTTFIRLNQSRHRNGSSWEKRL